MEKLIDEVKEDIQRHSLLLYMKGTKEMPMCGFSKAALDILESYDVPVETRNVLSNPAYREALRSVTDWPTIPQIFIQGEFIGGSDILHELHASGELKQKLDKLLQTQKEASA